MDGIHPNRARGIHSIATRLAAHHAQGARFTGITWCSRIPNRYRITWPRCAVDQIDLECTKPASPHMGLPAILAAIVNLMSIPRKNRRA